MSSTLTTLLHIFFTSTSAAIFGLAQVNFGLLSICINTIVGASALFYHTMILALNIFRRALSSETEKTEKRQSFTLPLPYDRRHRSSSTTTDETGAIIPKSVPSGPFYSIVSLLSILILTVLTIIGFAITIEVSLQGASSLPPAEIETTTTFPFNLKVQIAQCTFLGVQSLLWLVMLALCIRGRSRISEAEDLKNRDAFWYGLPNQPFEPPWDKREVITLSAFRSSLKSNVTPS